MGNNNRYNHYNRHGRGLFKGLSLLIIGCVLIAIGLSFGGTWTTPRWWPWDGNGFHLERNDGFDGDADERIEDIQEQDGVLPIGITDLHIDLKAASLVIRTGADASYHVSGFERGGIEIDIDGSKVEIEEKHWRHSFDFNSDFPKPRVEILLPEGVKLDKCSIEVGAGAVNADGLNTHELTLESGAGSIRGNKIASERVRIQTGAGSLELDSCDFGDTRIETGAGRVLFEGSLGKESEISTGAGSVEMKLPGSIDDYQFEFERGIGSVRIGDESFNGVGNGTAGNRNAPKRIKLSSGVGSVRVDFAD